MFSTMTPGDNMRKAASRGFINATDCADYLTKKGVPFRDAYKTVGRLVNQCIKADETLETMTMRDFCSNFQQVRRRRIRRTRPAPVLPSVRSSAVRLRRK